MSALSRFMPPQRIAETGHAVRGVFRRWETASIFALVAAGYTFVYLWAIADLTVQSTPGITVDIVASADRAFQRGPGRFAFEGIAIVDLGVARYIVSPVNTTIALGVGSLVGLNVSLSYLAYTRPSACGIGGSTGLLAAIPAAVSGGACCAPVLFIVLGVTATSTTLAVVTWLLPVSVAILLGTLVYLAEQIDQTALQYVG